MKVITFRLVVVASLAAVAVLTASRRNRWIRNIRALESTLAAAENHPKKHVGGRTHQTWEELPPVVQRYFNGAVLFPVAKYGDESESSPFHPHSAPMIESVRFQQKGQFGQKDNWLLFAAHQTVSAIPDNPGFVWLAEIDSVSGWWKRWLPKILVCDAWVKGEGHMLVSLHGALPLVSEGKFADYKDALRKGEMMRWLAEAFLTPTALLPEAGIVTWKAIPNHPNRAMLSMVDPFIGSAAELEVFFDGGDGIEISGTRPAVEGSTVVNRSWAGRMSEFQFAGNMWIPMHAEAGWINEVSGALDLYFVADISAFEIEQAQEPVDHDAATSTQ